MESVGLSVVSPVQELLYCKVAALQLAGSWSGGVAHVDACVAHVQVDNCLPASQYPVMLLVPKPLPTWRKLRRSYKQKQRSLTGFGRRRSNSAYFSIRDLVKREDSAHSGSVSGTLPPMA